MDTFLAVAVSTALWEAHCGHVENLDITANQIIQQLSDALDRTWNLSTQSCSWLRILSDALCMHCCEATIVRSLYQLLYMDTKIR